MSLSAERIAEIERESKPRGDIVRSARALANAIERFSGDGVLPESGGLGTDGTCWTDEEMRAWLLQLGRNLSRRFKA